MPGQGVEALSPIPHTLPYTALPLRYSSVSFITFFNKLVNISVSLNSAAALAN